MRRSCRTGMVGAVAGLSAALAMATSGPAVAGDHWGHGHGHGGEEAAQVTVLASGLDGPFGIDRAGDGFVVAESVSGQVTRIDRRGNHQVLITGAPGVAGVAQGRHSLYAVLGGPNEDGAPPVGTYPPSSVIRSGPDGRHPKVIADLLAYELAKNPDGQVQLVDGVPVDALSNPFSMNLSRYGLLVADGGANDVLRVDPRTGRVVTFFVPPTVTDVPACLEPGAQANPGTVGCDPVPTGIAVADGSVYVSTLGAEVPGAGRVYRLDPRTGAVRAVWKGLTAPTGIAVSPDGAIYVSEVLFGSPEGDGPPPPGFDPSTVGRITRIDHGRMTHAQVTMPTGLVFRDDHLYASAWSIASFLGIDHAGQVVRVSRRAFH